MARKMVVGSLLVLMAVWTVAAQAQAPASGTQAAAQTAAPAASPAFYAIPIGQAVSLEDARRAVAAAMAEAQKNHWFMAAAVVDPNGDLVYFERMENVQRGSIKASIGKARSAALYKRPTKVFEDAIVNSPAGVRLMGLEGAVPLEGGIPLVVDGKLIGGIGLSGDLSSNDGKCAKAGADALAKK